MDRGAVAACKTKEGQILKVRPPDSAFSYCPLEIANHTMELFIAAPLSAMPDEYAALFNIQKFRDRLLHLHFHCAPVK